MAIYVSRRPYRYLSQNFETLDNRAILFCVTSASSTIFGPSYIFRLSLFIGDSKPANYTPPNILNYIIR